MATSYKLSFSFFLISFALFYITTDLFCNASWGAEALGWGFHHNHDAVDISSLISQSLFKSLFLHKDAKACPAKHYLPFFYQCLQILTTGDLTTRKREVAAFLAQISHETSGGGATAPDGRYAWSLCFKEEATPHSDYRECTTKWPCSPGKSYKGRGPLQLSW